jgi:hypothetical protein
MSTVSGLGVLTVRPVSGIFGHSDVGLTCIFMQLDLAARGWYRALASRMRACRMRACR